MTDTQTDGSREFDVVVFGASGFTGRLVAGYINERYGADDGFAWAIAGRNRQRLEQAAREADIDTRRVPILTVDSEDREALQHLAARSRVVLTTVGPYAKYGSQLVAACVQHGTGYCDLAGEVQWMRRMIDTHAEAAAASGARIVHACGFDSVPSDLGVWFLQQAATERFGRPCERVTLLVRAMRGGMSGGTAASLLNAVKEGKEDREAARALTDPYSLNPPELRQGADGRDQRGAVYEKVLGVWTSPFIMAAINERIVRRTNALLNFPYGRQFRYREAMSTGPGISGRLKALSAAALLGSFMALGSVDLTREQIVRRLLPDPGDGPDEAARERGFFNFILVGSTADGRILKARITGDRDPGYGSTSRMIAEAAICLARDDVEQTGGFWTPAAALNGKLLERLRAHAGLTFEIIDP